MEPLKIIDIIDHKSKLFTQRFLVLNRKLHFEYEKVGKWLIAEDNGFFSFYYYEKPCGRFKAFGGSEFDINLKNGEVIKATGQYWSGIPETHAKKVIGLGYGTVDGLASCNVFYSTNVNPAIIGEWLEHNTPSNNYNKYAPRHSDYRKDEIESRW